MRVAVVSDIHGNLTAFNAVLADLRQAAPDIVFHGGDLADAGSSPVEIVDCIRALGWPGVLGNTDDMLATPQSLEDFATGLPQLQTIWAAAREMAAWTREKLGEDRLCWLRALPLCQVHDPLALVHAGPASPWRAPSWEAADAALESVYGPLQQPVAAYGHIHRPYVRAVAGITVVNCGSVSLSYDGDPRASYLLLDNGKPQIRRVAYNLERAMKALRASGLPHAEWVARTLRAAAPQMP